MEPLLGLRSSLATTASLFSGTQTASADLRWSHSVSAMAHMPASFRPLLLSCNLIGTPKRDGSTRPVVIGEALYKMPAFMVMDSMKGEMIESLGSSQFAFLPGGFETAALLLKALLEDGTGFACCMLNLL